MPGYSRLSEDVDTAAEVAQEEAEILARVGGLAIAIVEIDGAIALVEGLAGLGTHEGCAYVRDACRIGWEIAQTFSPGARPELKIHVPRAEPPHRWIRVIGGSRVHTDYSRATWLLLGSERLALGQLRHALIESAARVAEYRHLLPALAVTDDPQIFRAQKSRRRSRVLPLPPRVRPAERPYAEIRREEGVYPQQGGTYPEITAWVEALAKR